MSNINYAHLHLHTEYSLLDGANKIEVLAKKIKELGMSSVAITDHGNMFGAIEFYKTMKKYGIKPIIGIEAYIHNNDELNFKSNNFLKFHVCLLAKNEVGYKNLMYLSSQSYIHGFYHIPRINKKILRQHSEGIICTSACLSGEIAWHLNLNPNMNQTKLQKKKIAGANGYKGALEAALEYKEIFKDDFYIEIMRHGVDDQIYIDNELIKLSLETGIKLIATNDAHYTSKHDSKMQETAMMIAMGTTIDDKNRLKHNISEFFIKSQEEMSLIFMDIPEAIENTNEIVNKCNLEIQLKDEENPPTAPNFKFVKEYAERENLNFSDEDSYFKYKCVEGLEKRLKNIDTNLHSKYKKRLKDEMEIIISMKFCGYMLIVWDFINYAKNNDIPVGPGRGSAAGSLVAFSLNITDIDPIKYDLLFERFLNPERISMPDIDTDFCQRKRHLIFEYMKNKYGQFNVAQVITFGKMLAKSVIRDVGRVLGYPIKEVDELAKLIPTQIGITLEEARHHEQKLDEMIKSRDYAKKIWDMALQLEGLNRNAGKHAAALVLDSSQELWNKIPLFVTNKMRGDIITQYSMKHLEDVDLIKFDFLGLKTLTVIYDTLKIIKDSNNIEINLSTLDVNDEAVYKTLRNGNTLGIFQLESNGMQEVNKKLQPTCIDDAIALLALFRPGPMQSGMTNDYVERKHGRAKITYMFNELEPILKPTYGVIVYQEQVMQIVQVIGGFSLGEADIIRRAMGKKDIKTMNENREKFSNGAVKNGFDKKKSIELFDMIANFAEYGFNKSHSVAYGMLTFQTAYLKTYFKHEFMAAMLTSESNKVESISKYIHEVRLMGIEILNPHVNYSMIDFSVLNDGGEKKIIFGLGAIKGVGDQSLENILEVRESKGKFKNLEDFISRLDFNRTSKRTFDPLIKSGSLDNLGYNRATMLANVNLFCDKGRINTKNKKNKENWLALENKDVIDFSCTILEELDSKKLLEFEYESIGIYLSGHPLDNYRDEISKYSHFTNLNELIYCNDGDTILIVAKAEEVIRKISKSNKVYGIINIIDLHRKEVLTVFENELNVISNMDLSEPIGFLCKIDKEKQIEDEEQEEESFRISLRALDIFDFETAKNKKFKRKISKRENNSAFNDVNEDGNGILKIDAVNKQQKGCMYVLFESINEQYIKSLSNLAKNHPGDYELLVVVKNLKEKDKVHCFKSEFLVNDSLVHKLKKMDATCILA